MFTVLLGRSVPRNHLPNRRDIWVEELPVARLPSATEEAAPPVQVALEGSPLTNALVMETR